jgi:hypothetical protein
MANEYYKGFAVIKNSAGSVALTGRATIVNSSPSVGVEEQSPINEHKDANGVPRTLTRPYRFWEMTMDVTVGVGQSGLTPSTVKPLGELASLGDAIVTSGFGLDSCNWDSGEKAIVWRCSVQLATDQLSVLRITARRYRDNAAAVIDFATNSWATL